MRGLAEDALNVIPLPPPPFSAAEVKALVTNKGFPFQGGVCEPLQSDRWVVFGHAISVATENHFDEDSGEVIPKGHRPLLSLSRAKFVKGTTRLEIVDSPAKKYLSIECYLGDKPAWIRGPVPAIDGYESRVNKFGNATDPLRGERGAGGASQRARPGRFARAESVISGHVFFWTDESERNGLTVIWCHAKLKICDLQKSVVRCVVCDRGAHYRR